ncbi:MAG: Spy/CpxP family protein refolding chaperone, partial [Ignavibacteriae bacterium]|nr:Spy/CpxP family protein refolding chaperone [Ignavibacteriota bacterium]
KLNLTDAQKDKFDKIHFSQEEQNIEFKAALQKNKLEIKKLLKSDNFNENELKNLIKNGREIRNEMMDGRINTWFQVYNILDETQKQEWKENFKRLANDFDGGRFEGRKFNRDGKDKRIQPGERKEFREQMNKEN